jgi:hypothetical protein
MWLSSTIQHTVDMTHCSSVSRVVHHDVFSAKTPILAHQRALDQLDGFGGSQNALRLHAMELIDRKRQERRGLTRHNLLKQLGIHGTFSISSTFWQMRHIGSSRRGDYMTLARGADILATFVTCVE